MIKKIDNDIKWIKLKKNNDDNMGGDHFYKKIQSM
jgi:hypothetical protein